MTLKAVCNCEFERRGIAGGSHTPSTPHVHLRWTGDGSDMRKLLDDALDAYKFYLRYSKVLYVMYTQGTSEITLVVQFD